MNNPFAELVGFAPRIGRRGSGRCSAALELRPQLLNPNGVAHGGVLFALADTAMGAALHTTLARGEFCATVEIKIHFLQPVLKGRVRCSARVVQRGGRIAVLEAQLKAGRKLVAQALGTFAIFAPRTPPGTHTRDTKRARLSK